MVRDKITFNIDSELKKELKFYALTQNKTVTDLLIQWITENVKNEEKA